MVTTKPKLKGPPPDMEVPPDIVLKRSSVDPERIGIWCRSHIPTGKKFGPFMGNRVQEATDDMDPTFVWEIVDLSSKEFLFYIDATDEHEGNWMRYVNCARYFEEQNIVSEQEGVDIIYRAIKDIYPEEEILTWYEKAPFRKKKGRKAKPKPNIDAGKDEAGDAESVSRPSTRPAQRPRRVVSRSSSVETDTYGDDTDDEAGTSQEPEDNDVPDVAPTKAETSVAPTATKRQTHTTAKRKSDTAAKQRGVMEQQSDTATKGQSDKGVKGQSDAAVKSESDAGDMHVSQRGRRRKVTKYWEMETDLGLDDDEDSEADTRPLSGVRPESSMTPQTAGSDEEWGVSGTEVLPRLTACSTAAMAPVTNPGQYYQFDVKSWHVVKSRVGRKLFQCDICSSVYRHSFSLKRHYIRNHLNYRYVSPTDLMNCCIPTKSMPPTGQADPGEGEGQDEGPARDGLISGDPVRDGLISGGGQTSVGSSVGTLECVEGSGKLHREASIHSDDTSRGSSESPNENPGSNRGVNSYEEDTEEYLDSDSDIDNDETPTRGEPGDVDPFTGKDSSVDEDSICSDASQDMKPREVKAKPTISIMNVSHAGFCGISDESDTDDNDSESTRPAAGDRDDSTQSTETYKHRLDLKVSQGQGEVHNNQSSGNTKSLISGMRKKVTAGNDSNDPDDSTKNTSGTKIFSGGAFSSPEVNGHTSTPADPPINNHSVDEPDMSVTMVTAPGLPRNLAGSVLYGLFRCNVCADVFDTATMLKKHLSNHPDATDGRKTFACEKCEMKFAHKQNLMRHQAVHTGTRPYICSYCDKKFPTSTNLRRHEKVHQGHKFSCPHCSTTFTQTGDLKKHVRKAHPELFSECGFCTRYFVKKRLLVDHLLEMHDGKTVEENDKEIEAKQEAFRYDLNMDKAESMRLAIAHGKKKQGPKFACTVCRRRFHDYPSMCRHRRLAHQRPIFVPPIRDENGDVIDDAASQACTTFRRGFYDPEDEAQAVFYANVANAIADNLQNFIEGKEEHLSKVEAVVKWRGSGVLPESMHSTKSPKAFLDSIAHNLQEFNFPRDFKLKTAANNYRSVPYSSDGRISWKNKKVLPAADRTHTESGGGGTEESRDPGATKDIGIIKDTTNVTGVAKDMNEDTCITMDTGVSKDKGATKDVMDSKAAAVSEDLCKDTSVAMDTGKGGSQDMTRSALMHFLQSDITSVSQRMTSTSILAKKAELTMLKPPGNHDNLPPPSREMGPKILPIRVPQIRTCKICRSLFHNQTLYVNHMYLKHGVHVAPDSGVRVAPDSGVRVAPDSGVRDSERPHSVHDNRQPKPAHMNNAMVTAHRNTAMVSPNSVRATLNVCSISPNGQMLSPNSRMLSPNSHMLSPNSQMLSPNSQMLSPNSQMLSPNSRILSPNSQMLSPNSHILRPNSQILSPINISMSPNSALLSPTATMNYPTKHLARIPNGYPMVTPHSPAVSVKSEPRWGSPTAWLSPWAPTNTQPRPWGPPTNPWAPPTAPSSPGSDARGPVAASVTPAAETGDMQPLDLSKKAHLAGYKLADRPSSLDKSLHYSQADDSASDKIDTASSTEEEPEVKVEEKPVSPEPRYICMACYGRYDAYDELIDHQEADHPNVKCGYTQLHEEVARNWKITPNPIGALNVCSTQLPPVTASPKRTNKLVCTKCSKTFQCMGDLHGHIEECADPYRPKMMFVYYYPGAKNRHFFLPGSKGEMVKVEKGQKFNRNLSESPRKKKAGSAATSTTQETEPIISEDSQNAVQRQNSVEDADDMDGNGKKRRRRNYELLYNPLKHIRRREMAEVIDTPKCSGCNGLFSTISLLERHIPMCRHKGRIQDQAVPKEVPVVPEVIESDDEDAYDPKKHMCIYCQKQFTYLGMLRKHVFDVCNVRRDLVEKGEYIDEEWEKEISARAGQSQPRTISRQSSLSSLNGIESLDTGDNSMDAKPGRGGQRGRRRRRGNGWYKGKGNVYKKKETGGADWEWERYFVLDETFMGVYNAVQGDEDEPQPPPGDENSRTSWPPGYGEESNDSALMAGKWQQPQEGTTEKSHHHALEQIQNEKKALFAELTKPIEHDASKDVNTIRSAKKDVNTVRSAKKDVNTVRSAKKDGVTPRKSKKANKETPGKAAKQTEKAVKKTPVKNDSPQKAGAKAVDSLASVKQKLAKKIIENKKQQQGSGRKQNTKSPASTQNIKSPVKPTKVKSPVKSPVKLPNKKSNAKPPAVKLQAKAQKANKDIISEKPPGKKRGPKPKQDKSLLEKKPVVPSKVTQKSNKVKMAILAKVAPKMKEIKLKGKLLKPQVRATAKAPKAKLPKTPAVKTVRVPKLVSKKPASAKKAEPNVSESVSEKQVEAKKSESVKKTGAVFAENNESVSHVLAKKPEPKKIDSVMKIEPNKSGVVSSKRTEPKITESVSVNKSDVLSVKKNEMVLDKSASVPESATVGRARSEEDMSLSDIHHLPELVEDHPSVDDTIDEVVRMAMAAKPKPGRVAKTVSSTNSSLSAVLEPADGYSSLSEIVTKYSKSRTPNMYLGRPPRKAIEEEVDAQYLDHPSVDQVISLVMRGLDTSAADVMNSIMKPCELSDSEEDNIKLSELRNNIDDDMKPLAVCGDISMNDKPMSPAKPELSLNKPELAPAKPELAPAKPELAPAKPELSPAKPELSPAKPELAAAKPECSPAKPELSPAKPELSPAKPERAPARPEHSPAKPELFPAKPELSPAKPERAPAKPELSPAKPELSPAKPELSPAKPEISPTKPHLSPAKRVLLSDKPVLSRKRTLVKSKSAGKMSKGVMSKSKAGLSETAAAIVKGAKRRKSEGVAGSLTLVKSPGSRTHIKSLSFIHRSPGKGTPKKRNVLEALGSFSRSPLSGDELVKVISQATSPIKVISQATSPVKVISQATSPVKVISQATSPFRKLSNILGHNKAPKTINDLLHVRSKSEPTTGSVRCSVMEPTTRKRPKSLAQTSSESPVDLKKTKIVDDVLSMEFEETPRSCVQVRTTSEQVTTQADDVLMDA